MLYPEFILLGGKMHTQNHDFNDVFILSKNEFINNWNLESWINKNKPKLWLKVFESCDIKVWRDVGYGGIKLETSSGSKEGKQQASIDGITVSCVEGSLEVHVNERSEN
jgi:hypothetical protein